MNFITKSVLPKIKEFVKKEKTIQNLWIKCNSCNQMIFEKDLKKNLNICSMCNFHMPYYPQERLKVFLMKISLNRLITRLKIRIY